MAHSTGPKWQDIDSTDALDDDRKRPMEAAFESKLGENGRQSNCSETGILAFSLAFKAAIVVSDNFGLN